MIATSKLSQEAAEELLAGMQDVMSTVMRRVQRIADVPPDARVLDVGAAQGRAVIALRRMGYRAYGVEPAKQALDVFRQLAEQTGTDPVAVIDGMAEKLAFPDGSFDVVLAYSVMEHVGDCERAMAEASRVLAPGGVYWFSVASALCPRQHEIRRFPAFGWYPNRLKRRIMRWAVEKRPALVNHTETPAINWLTPWKARRMLRRAGFGRVYDRWDLRLPEEGGSAYRLALRLIRLGFLTKLAADVLLPMSSYAALKPR